MFLLCLKIVLYLEYVQIFTQTLISFVQFKMAKHNLFLFYEESEDDRVISSNIVRLYMNRLTIEEDRQNEVIGVKNLTKPIFPEDGPWVIINESEKKRKIDMDKWRSFEEDKVNKDFVIFGEAFEKNTQCHS